MATKSTTKKETAAKKATKTSATKKPKSTPETITFRPLKAEEISICPRPTDRPNEACLLLYKTSRTVQNLLDETVGTCGWQNRYTTVADKVYCELSILLNGTWVTKSDTGEESELSPEKGQASDALKRVATLWGIGRELYTAPRIYTPAKTVTKYDDDGIEYYELANPREFESVYVEHIAYEDDKIIELVLKNKKNGMLIFSMMEDMKESKEEQKEEIQVEGNNEDKTEFVQPETINAAQLASIVGLLKNTYTNKDTMLKHYGLDSLEDMRQDDYQDALYNLNNKLKPVTEKQLIHISEELSRTGTEIKNVLQHYKVHDLTELSCGMYMNLVATLEKKASIAA